MSARLMRIGVIGLGTVGQTHLAVLRQLGVSEIYGADPAAAARDYARTYATRCFDDFDEMLSTVELDGVVVATPPRTHRGISLACLRAGLGVLTEKPMALSVEDCEVIANAAASSRGPFLVGFCHRFQPQVMRLRSLIDAGTFGPAVLVNISFTHGLTEQGREWITDPEQAGGGVLFDSGSHAIDLFRYLVGDLDEVHGMTVGDRARVDDCSVLSLRSGAVLGSVSLSWKAPPWHGLIDVIGTNGRARVEYDSDRVKLKTRLGDGTWRTVRTPKHDRFVLQMCHFLGCVRGNATPLTSARDGLEATRAILRVYADRGTNGTRGSFSVSGHMPRTHAISGSSEAAMVRRSPARKFK